MIKSKVVFFNIILGSLLVAIAYYFLFLPQNIVVGGVTGIAIIFNKIFGEVFISSSMFILVLNIIFLIIGLFVLGRQFFFKTLLGSIFLPIFIAVFELLNLSPNLIFEIDQKLKITSLPMNPTSQVILALLLGSILTGIGLGLCFKVNASTGGMDVIQKIMSKVFYTPFSKMVYITDGIVVIGAIFVFGIERTMYSLIAIYLMGIFIDLVQLGFVSRRTAFILSLKNEEIKHIITEKLKRGVTVVDASGGYSGEKYDMLICTLSRRESYLMRDLIHIIDPTAFIFFVFTKEVFGDGF